MGLYYLWQHDQKNLFLQVGQLHTSNFKWKSLGEYASKMREFADVNYIT